MHACYDAAECDDEYLSNNENAECGNTVLARLYFMSYMFLSMFFVSTRFSYMFLSMFFVSTRFSYMFLSMFFVSTRFSYKNAVMLFAIILFSQVYLIYNNNTELNANSANVPSCFFCMKLSASIKKS